MRLECFALLLCAPGLVHAEPAVYTVAVSNAAPVSFAWHVTYSSAAGNFTGGAAPVTSLGGWEVTVAFDSSHCGISCSYRRKPDAFGRTPVSGVLPPPITAIQIYSNSASKPTTIIVDPAGISFPAAVNRVVASPEKLCLPGKKVFAAVSLQVTGSSRASLVPPSFREIANSSVTWSPSVPLRI